MVGQVSAKPLDVKCELSYFFWDGERPTQETEFAKIDPETGKITSRKTFDYEEESSYAVGGKRKGNIEV